MNKKEIEELKEKIKACDLSEVDKSRLIEIVSNNGLTKLEKLTKLGEVFRFSSEILKFLSRFIE